MSRICEHFSCPPDVALRQDPAVVLPVLEFRLAEAAVETHESDVTKMTEAMTDLWLEITAALPDNGG